MSLTLANGSRLPLIGFGTNTGPGDEGLAQTFDLAIEAGYRHFDTANIYQNEKILGTGLKKWFKSGKLKREDIFITTKLPIVATRTESVELFIKKSLENLGTDYIDLYLIHFPLCCKYDEVTYFKRDENGHPILEEGPTDHAGLWKEMEKQVELKQTRYIGLSNYNIRQIEIILKCARIKPACLQVEISPYLQEHHLVDFCRKNNITVVGFSPLGASDYNRRMKKYFSNYEPRPIPDILNNEVIHSVAQKYSKSAAQVALRFLIQSGVIPIPKSTNQRRIKENLDIFDFELDDIDMATLRNLDVGEEARITTFREAVKGIEDHIEYPWGPNR